MNKELEELVITYQKLNAQRLANLPTKDEGIDAEIDASYTKIRNLCEAIVRRVATRFRMKGVDVEEFAEEKLQACMASFSRERGDNFRGLYQVALVKHAIDESRSLKRRPLTMEPQADSDQDPFNQEFLKDFIEQMACYARRKRNIVESLELKPDTKLATLLIDQRHRMSVQHDSFRHFQASLLGKSKSSWVASMEIWKAADALRCIDRDGSQIGKIWDCFSSRLDRGEVTGAKSEMVAAINEAGTGISNENWRQKVCRYLKAVEDQVDQETWKYFHSNLYRNKSHSGELTDDPI